MKFNGFTYSDEYNRMSPREMFGAYVQNLSYPRLTFDVALDPGVTAVHKLRVTQPNGTVLELENADGVFDLATPPQGNFMDGSYQPGVPIAQAGTYRWAYTVTDSAGHSASEAGSFDALPYQAPRFNALTVQRYSESVDDEGNPVYTASADGNHVWISIDAEVSPLGGKNAWQLTRSVDYERGGTLLSGADGERILHVNDRSLDSDEYAPDATYPITFVLHDQFLSTSVRVEILKAGGYMHITPNGVAVGQRSSGTPRAKRFEVAEDYEAIFYGGIAGVTNYASGETPTGGRWIDGKPIYRYVYHAANRTPGALFTISNLDTLISLTGYGHEIGADIWTPLNYRSVGSDTVRASLSMQYGVVSWAAAGNVSGARPIWVIAEYTKK